MVAALMAPDRKQARDSAPASAIQRKPQFVDKGMVPNMGQAEDTVTETLVLLHRR